VNNTGTVTVAPLGAERLSVNGNFTTSGTVNLELGGPAAATQYDQMAISGIASFAGALNVALINGYNPTTGQVPHTLFTFGSRAIPLTDFQTVSLPSGFTRTYPTAGTSLVVTSP
jgi:hypothetical protein